jgi:hypothetical protein
MHEHAKYVAWLTLNTLENRTMVNARHSANISSASLVQINARQHRSYYHKGDS